MNQESQNFEFERESDFGRESGLIEERLLGVGLTREQATEISGEIYGAALELDSVMNQVLRDPDFISRYIYDGLLIKNKEKDNFYVAPDGAALFEILKENDMLPRYFGAAGWDVASDGLKNKLKQYLGQARALLSRWQEKKEIPTSFSQEINERIKGDLAESEREKAEKQEALKKERSFFEEYEKQMGSPGAVDLAGAKDSGQNHIKDESDFYREIHRVTGELAGKALDIEKLLERFWGKKKATEFVAGVYSVATELDDAVLRFQHDPEIMEKYEYGVGHFIDRKTKEEYYTPDGAYLLNLLLYTIRTGDSKLSRDIRNGESAEMEGLSNEIKALPDLVGARVLNWQKNKTMALNVDLEKAAKLQTSADSKLFEYYGEQMKEFMKKEKDDEEGSGK